MLNPGDIIGNYRILEPIAGGGMAMVYKAEHSRFGEVVAIKLMLPNLAQNPKARHRFEQEAYVQRQLNHPNIVRVLDVVEQQSSFGIVMEYIDGDTLESWLEKNPGPLGTTKALAMMEGVLNGMAYAHQREVVHRDLKPANVMLHRTADGSLIPKIADFGLVKVLADADSMTRTGAMMGTMPYMAPEQAAGKKDIDARADVFALGVMMWRLAQGVLPVDPRNIIATGKFYGGEADVPLIDGAEGQVIAKAMATDKEQRPQNADAFLRALRSGECSEMPATDPGLPEADSPFHPDPSPAPQSTPPTHASEKSNSDKKGLFHRFAHWIKEETGLESLTPPGTFFQIALCALSLLVLTKIAGDQFGSGDVDMRPSSWREFGYCASFIIAILALSWTQTAPRSEPKYKASQKVKLLRLIVIPMVIFCFTSFTYYVVSGLAESIRLENQGSWNGDTNSAFFILTLAAIAITISFIGRWLKRVPASNKEAHILIVLVAILIPITAGLIGRRFFNEDIWEPLYQYYPLTWWYSVLAEPIVLITLCIVFLLSLFNGHLPWLAVGVIFWFPFIFWDAAYPAFFNPPSPIEANELNWAEFKVGTIWFVVCVRYLLFFTALYLIELMAKKREAKKALLSAT